MEIPSSVQAAIAATFGNGRVAEVGLMLPPRHQFVLHPPYERVLLAIVGLAAGDVDQIAVYSRAAVTDWRDVLYWWETPDLAESASRRIGELIEKLEESDE